MVPTVRPEWLEPGMHLANLGPAEIDGSVMAQVDVVIWQGTSGLRVVKIDRVVVGVGHSPVAFVARTGEEVKRLPERTPTISGFKADSANYSDLISGMVAGRTAEDQITFTTILETRVSSFPPSAASLTRKQNSKVWDVNYRPNGSCRIFATDQAFISTIYPR